MGLLQDGAICLAFARVTYSAGVAECVNCQISSPLTVQNDTNLDLKVDAMTTEALWLMPEIIGALVLMNSSIPSSWGNIDDYVIDLLSRSYSGAWTALTNYLGQPTTSTSLTPRFVPSVPSLQARVNMPRVLIWLGIQLLATLCGVLFFVKQAGTKYRLIGDTTLAAFELDTSGATEGTGKKLKSGDILKLQPKGQGLKVVVT